MASEAEGGKAYKKVDDLESHSVVTTSTVNTGHDNKASSASGAHNGVGAVIDMCGNAAGVAIREGIILVTLTEHLQRITTANDSDKAYIVVRTGAGGGVGPGDVILCGLANPASFHNDRHHIATMNELMMRNLNIWASVPHFDYRVNKTQVGNCFRITIHNTGFNRINAGTVIPIIWKAI